MWLEAVVYTFFAFAVLGLIFVVFGYWIRHAQDILLYHPESPANSTVSCDAPDAWGITNSERVEIVTADGVTLAGYFMRTSHRDSASSSSSSAPVTGAAAAAAFASSSVAPNNNNSSGSHAGANAACTAPPPTIVYFHGNAGNVGHRLPIAKYLLDTARCDVLMVDYRGYGLSDAVRPCEVGLQLDAGAIMDWVVKHAALGSKIIVMGVSLGGAVSLWLASHRRYRGMISALILENTFVSISAMADSIVSSAVAGRFPHVGGKLLSFLVRRVIKPLILQIHWRSIDRIPQVAAPMLFLSGLRDEIVPPSHMRELFEAAIRAPRKRFVAFETGMHNDLCSKDHFFEHIARFVNDAVRK